MQFSATGMSDGISNNFNPINHSKFVMNNQNINKVDPIYVTKTYLPPFDEFVDSLKDIWDSHFVTNDGKFYRAFETELRNCTKVENLVCVGNGTLALQLAIRALGLEGEVITSPFSHPATSGSLYWERCTPVYVDVDPETMNICPKAIENRLDDRIQGIMGVHVYSNPCEVDQIEKISNENDLKVIYDAAHAFGATVNGKSVFSYGDLSTASFNATKGFHTMEGGAVFCKNDAMVSTLRQLAYFGMNTKKEVVGKFGTNAKLIEMCAIMGLINLKSFEDSKMRKRALYERYKRCLEGSRKLTFQRLTGEINYSYMPILAESETHKKELLTHLHSKSIYPREYFDLNLERVYSDGINCPVAEDYCRRVLCFPMSDYLTESDVDRICEATLEVCEV